MEHQTYGTRDTKVVALIEENCGGTGTLISSPKQMSLATNSEICDKNDGHGKLEDRLEFFQFGSM